MQTNATPAMREYRAPAPIAGVDRERGRRQEWRLGSAAVGTYTGARRWLEEGPGVCRLVFQRTGRSLVAQGGKLPDVDLRAGDWFAHLGPALDIQTWWGSEALWLAIPTAQLSRALLLQLQATPEAAIRTAGAARVCLELARTCSAQTDPVSEAVGATLGESLIELAKLAIIEQSAGKRSETIRETVRTRILGFIHRNLADPDLTIERIAERMQCTKRYLHKVFSEEGETLNQYIWSRRLELCRTHLLRADFSDKSITEIAFACGFSNAAHFSRSFRARFGASPRAFRRAAREG